MEFTIYFIVNNYILFLIILYNYTTINYKINFFKKEVFIIHRKIYKCGLS